MGERKVVINEAKNKTYMMHVWIFASKQARVGKWGEIARDRDRFHRRIQSIGMRIAHVLSPDHRIHMFNKLNGGWKNQ